ncbi:mitogen-activated protein kinase 7 isoform X2 [Engraulis encrasicolus]|uniref:mitogen-activated protein kinase 7 isoform X2 n=1 Tax=Engraulis encrasicolus TaxID=184585 RepID=UPI002FD4C349
MEQTTENESLSSERKDPEVEEGGIRRRLRDRDLLKKRKAEAEEKANQAESRKKERREERSTGKKGRPRKIKPPAEVQLPQEEGPLMNVAPAPAAETEAFPTIPAAPPESVEVPVVAEAEPRPGLLSIPVPFPLPSIRGPSMPVSLVPSAPPPLVFSTAGAVPASAPASSSALATSSGSAEKVLIEDLGPDEEEDLPLAQSDEIIGEGRPADEELPADMPEQDKTFSYPLFASPPLQQEYFPGNFI